MAVDGTFPSTAINIYTPETCGIFALTKGKVIPLSCVYPFFMCCPFLMCLSIPHRKRVPSLAERVVVSQPEGSREGIGVESGEV